MRMMAGNEESLWVRITEDRSEEGPQVRSQDRPEDDLARIIFFDCDFDIAILLAISNPISNSNLIVIAIAIMIVIVSDRSNDQVIIRLDEEYQVGDLVLIVL